MTEQEAIERLKRMTQSKEIFRAYEEQEACEMAIPALEKQIAKKLDYEGDGYADGEMVYDTWICPCCEERYEIGYDEYDYCPNCGQHIDRSEI